MYYFDWTATSPMSDKALDTYCQIAKTTIGNPSSVHTLGFQAKTILEDSRKAVAGFLKTKPEYITFTSGGTESDNIVIQSLLNNPVPGEVITSSIEHSAVLENKTILESNGWTFTSLRCPDGYLKTQDLINALNPKTRMVCIMAVNNVIGTVQNLKQIVSAIRDFEKTIKRKIHIHCDAVQALGKLDFYPELLDLDSAAFSSHKFSGPKGVGILYCRNKAILSLSRAGGQEKGLRGGTENIAGIAAMTTALQDSLDNLNSNYDKVFTYRKMIEKACKEKGYLLLSPSCDSDKEFSPYIITISVKPLPSEVYLRMMNDKGFCLSAGSACSTNSKGKAESVLSAMNILPEDRAGAIRISFGPGNTIEEVEALAKEL